MENVVIKKSGAKEPYRRDKLHRVILISADEAGVPQEERAALAEAVCDDVEAEIADKTEVSSAEIKQAALSSLDVRAPNVSSAWRAHDRIYWG